MDDLISRQDAIDAIKEFQHGAAEWKGEQEERSDIWHRADSAIASAIEIKLRVKKIPSAQQWIPCSERLPEEFKRVLCCTDKEEMFLACVYIFDNGYTFDNEERMMWDGDVVAWMPLPEPYKGGDE